MHLWLVNCNIHFASVFLSCKNVMIYVNNMCCQTYFLFRGTRLFHFYCYICIRKSFINNYNIYNNG